ncbi:MAG TPA: GNAT family N-acetyltransferase [Anaerolineaceae bacterium]
MDADGIELQIFPLTTERWTDLETLFGPKGAFAGCWCMWWRLPRKQFYAQQGEGNRLAFRAIVEKGEIPGILAYAGSEPVGWCAVAPRANYPGLARSKNLKPIDDQPVWSITCFYVRKKDRKKGVMRALIEGAAAFVRSQGGTIIEAYPFLPKETRSPDPSVYMGLLPAFQAAGFSIVNQSSERQVIVRKDLTFAVTG